MSDAIVLPETGAAEPRRTPTVILLMTARRCARSSRSHFGAKVSTWWLALMPRRRWLSLTKIRQTW